MRIYVYTLKMEVKVMKRNLIILTLVVFAFSSVFLLSSCAKKQVVAEEEEITALPEEEEEMARVEEEEASIEVEFRGEEEEEIEVAERAEILEPEEEEWAERIGPEEEEVALPERGVAILEGEAIYFDFDKSFIRPEYRAILREKGAVLRDNPSVHIRIEGNCDERGTNEYNIALGERRANSARSFLMSLGIPSFRIEAMSYGEERPLFLGHDENSWSRNRRDDFVVIKE
jgi:peptidoglycan-associated lipoprotein